MHPSSLPFLAVQMLSPLFFLPELGVLPLLQQRGSFLLVVFIWTTALVGLYSQRDRLKEILPISPLWFLLGMAALFLSWITSFSDLLPYLTVTETEIKISVVLLLVSFPLFFINPPDATTSGRLLTLSLLGIAVFSTLLAFATYILTLQAFPWQILVISAAGATLVLQNEISLRIAEGTHHPKILLRTHSLLWGVYPATLFLMTVLHHLPLPYLIPLLSLPAISQLLRKLRDLEISGTLSDRYRYEAALTLWLTLVLTCIASCGSFM